MYTNNAYLNDSHIDRKDKSNPLVVTMCGTYKLYTKQKLPTWRPRGRVDFQLLYVASGKAHFYFDKDGTDTIVHAGHMVLYRPKEPQKYVYYAKDHTEVYWVHFTGSSVTNLLRSYGITKDKRVFYCGSDPEYKNLFSVMIKELQMCKSGYSEMLEMYLRQIFIRLQRHFEQTIITDTSQIAEEIDKAIVYFSEHYNEAIMLMPMLNRTTSAQTGSYAISKCIPELRQNSLFCKKELIMLKHYYKINNITLKRLHR